MPATQLYEPANAYALARDHENDLSEDEEFFATEIDFFKRLRVCISHNITLIKLTWKWNLN